MEYGDYVCITFHPSKAKSSNIYTAIKVQDAYIVTVHSIHSNTLRDEGNKNLLVQCPSSIVCFANLIYANRINSRGMSWVFCDLRSQKTPHGILPVNRNDSWTILSADVYKRQLTNNNTGTTALYFLFLLLWRISIHSIHAEVIRYLLN